MGLAEPAQRLEQPAVDDLADHQLGEQRGRLDVAERGDLVARDLVGGDDVRPQVAGVHRQPDLLRGQHRLQDAAQHGLPRRGVPQPLVPPDLGGELAGECVGALGEGPRVGDRTGEGAGPGREHTEPPRRLRPPVVLQRGDQPAQPLDGDVPDLAQQAQQLQPLEVRGTVVGPGGAAQAPLRQQSLPQVVLHRPDRDAGGAGETAEA